MSSNLLKGDVFMQTSGARRLRRLIYTALFAALCFVATYIVVIPLPYGYVNAGDVFVLIAAFCLGPVQGAVAAALGCTLADLLSGFAIYAPATFVIKFAVALVAAQSVRVLKRLPHSPRIDIILRAISCLLAEMVMVVGYFVYECFLYGMEGALLTVVGNLLQGVFCAFGGLLLTGALRAIKPLLRELPELNR
jgi:uncharacterized membrane protein